MIDGSESERQVPHTVEQSPKKASIRRCRPAVSGGLAALVLVAANAAAQPRSADVVRIDAPNVVVINPRLITSGQPTAAALAELKAQGVEAVIYLAPPTVSDAVRDEQLIVTRQGLIFINLPIVFDNPTAADVEAFNAFLAALASRKVLVHCQINLRASALVFLYRTIVLKEDPRIAQEAMARVWSPTGPWRTLVQSELRKHQIAYELL